MVSLGPRYYALDEDILPIDKGRPIFESQSSCTWVTIVDYNSTCTTSEALHSCMPTLESSPT